VSGNGSQAEGRCPVCQARFRGVSICSRCGADPPQLMLLAAHAYSLRRSARRSLRVGDAQSALAAAKAAQNLHAIPQGGILEMVCAAAVGRAKLPSAPASPVVTETLNRGPRDAQGASSPTLVHEENPQHRLPRCPRSEIPFPVRWKTLCWLAAVLFVVTGYALGPNRRRTQGR
jgi:hypothetical protein